MFIECSKHNGELCSVVSCRKWSSPYEENRLMTTGYKNKVIYIHDLSVLIFLSLFYFVFPLAFIFFLFYMIIYFLSNEIDILARRVLVWNIFSLSCYDVVVAKFLDLGEYLMELFQRSLDDSHVWSCL